MKIITTPSGHEYRVDDEDYERLVAYRWYAMVQNGGYAYTRFMLDGKRQSVRMHRIIMGVQDKRKEEVVVDHINGDTSDNRKANLRLATIAENSRNAKPRQVFPGVTAHRGGGWKSKICVNRQQIPLGVFATKEEASAAYVVAADKYHGEFSFARRFAKS